jgi:hypothetical protein
MKEGDYRSQYGAPKKDKTKEEEIQKYRGLVKMSDQPKSCENCEQLEWDIHNLRLQLKRLGMSFNSRCRGIDIDKYKQNWNNIMEVWDIFIDLVYQHGWKWNDLKDQLTILREIETLKVQGNCLKKESERE